MVNVANKTGVPRKNCERPACAKKIPLTTSFGRVKTQARLAGQKYCSPTCARLHYHEENALTATKVANAEKMLNQFIYSPRPQR